MIEKQLHHEISRLSPRAFAPMYSNQYGIVVMRASGFLAICIAFLLGSQVSAEEPNQERILIRAEQIFTADGSVISPGEVLVSDGVITYVGPGIELGLPAEELEVHTLAPGFIDAASSAGLENSGAEVSREITPV
ncbi:MAG: hypothetical protein AAGG44_17565 [Planctomycetota bacterium]